MSEALKPLLARLSGGDALTPAELDGAFAEIMEGAATDAQTGAFLALLGPHLEQPEIIAAGARALRARMLPVTAPQDAIDVCGTGGDGAHTLNVSTATAFVLAGGGVTVAKHGNRAMSSRSGAADVLEAVGVTLTGDRKVLESCLSEARLAFLFAQNHHPAMRNVAGARRELGFRTIFNLLGPLANPAGVTRQLVGVYAPRFVLPLAKALCALGATRAWVVHGAGGLDELACAEGNQVAAVADALVTSLPDLSVPGARYPAGSIAGGDAAFNAAALRALLEGRSKGSAYEDHVLLNAAAAFIVAGRATDLAEGVELGRDALHSGRALRTLETVVAITGGRS